VPAAAARLAKAARMEALVFGKVGCGGSLWVVVVVFG
jgi:hypothetical protein